MSHPNHRPLAAVATLVAFLAPVASVAQSRAPAQTQGRFIIRRGNDTVAVEHFTHDGTSLIGDIVVPKGAHLQYVLLLKADGTPERVDLTRTPRQGSPVKIGVEFVGRSAHAAISAAEEREEVDFPTPLPATPFLVQSFAMTEEIVRRARLAPGQHVKWTAVRLGAGDTATVTIARVHADSVSITMADVGVTVAIDGAGRVVGAVYSRQPWTLERVR